MTTIDRAKTAVQQRAGEALFVIGVLTALLLGALIYLVSRGGGGADASCAAIPAGVANVQEATRVAFETYELSVVGYQNRLSLGADRSYMDALTKRYEVDGQYVLLNDNVNNCF